jgi:thiopurine S-methyltransferase
MEIAYWQERWHSGAIGFHEGTPNALLVEFARFFAHRQRVLVPLCGKSVDLAWLAQRGLLVTGVEVVRAAIDAFFVEQRLPPHKEKRGPFTAHVSRGVEIVEGDMFAMKPELIGTFDCAYDRAALIALAPMTRVKYVDTLRALLRPGARMLLETISYDQRLTPGPPWSIDHALVRSLFRRGFVVEPLAERPAEIRSKLKEAGVKVAQDGVYLLTRL